MIKISKLADYAVVVLATLGQSDKALMTATGISAMTRLPEPTVAKVLKILAKGEILESVRGANGGYRLTKSSHAITVADIVRTIDGPIALTTCVDNNHAACDFEAGCPVKGRWDSVNVAVRAALESVTLADMLNTKNTMINTDKKEGAHERYISGNH